MSNFTRPAKLNDLDAVVDVVLAAMPLDPQWNYRFPYRDIYPEDHRKYTKRLFHRFIEPSCHDWQVMVAEAPSIEQPRVSKIVAFAVWDISYVSKTKQGSDDCYQPQKRSFIPTSPFPSASLQASANLCGTQFGRTSQGLVHAEMPIHLV